MTMPEYISWGFALWVLYMAIYITGTRPGSSRSRPEMSKSWKDAMGMALVAWVAVMLWPITLTLTLASDLRRPT